MGAPLTKMTFLELAGVIVKSNTRVLAGAVTWYCVICQWKSMSKLLEKVAAPVLISLIFHSWVP